MIWNEGLCAWIVSEMDVNPFGFGQDHGGPGVDPHIEEHHPFENDGVRSTPLNEIVEVRGLRGQMRSYPDDA